jgi:hypothetical protein
MTVGKRERALKRRNERLENYLDKPITITQREINNLAHREAEKYFDEIRENMVSDVKNAIAVAWGYLLAKALEESYDWFYTRKNPEIGIRRISVVLDKFMKGIVELANGDIDIVELAEDFNSRGIYVKEDTDESTDTNGLSNKDRATS